MSSIALPSEKRSIDRWLNSKANPKKKVVTAMDINIKAMRKEQGIKLNDEK